MTIRNLNFFFEPKAVVLAGASRKPGSIGFTVAHNLRRSGFNGEIAFVNPRYTEVDGIACFASVDRLPFKPELAIIATPPHTVPQLVAEFGAKGCRAVIVITAGIKGDLAQAMLNAARPYLLRIIGPNCMGIQVPRLRLDASFAQQLANPGHIALVSQSGAIMTAMLDWAAAEKVGFSHVVSVGDVADVDIGDMLDYLAGDVQSRAVFLYLEAVTHAAKFMSAARRCARAKPVIAIKAGRRPEGARAAASHTGALAGADAVYDAALRRAGVLRVFDLDDMFDAAEMLARLKGIGGDRLAIVTNGGGAGVLASDTLADLGGKLAALDPKTIETLDSKLPPAWSRGNPIDIIGDAGADRYENAMDAALGDPNTDAVLVVNCPTALASSLDGAKAAIAAIDRHRKTSSPQKPVIASWLGATTAAEPRALFQAAHIPEFTTPGDAVRGFMSLVRYGRAQAELMQSPPILPADLHVDQNQVRSAIGKTLAEGRSMMTEPEAKAALAAYGIPAVTTLVAPTPEKVGEAAARLLSESASVAVKILAPALTHKSDIGGVRLDIASAEEAMKAATQMLQSIGKLKPDAELQGFTVQPMIKKPDAYELILGMTSDPVFGPVILFGAGGTGVEAIGDTATALPPLDLKLAGELIASTRIYRLLRGFRDKPPVDLNALALCLIKLCSLVIHHREIRELDINPLLADEKGMIALDARIKVESLESKPATPLAIRPYPRQWEAHKLASGGQEIFIRPIRPDDEPLYAELMARMTPEDIRLRLFMPVREFSKQFLARQTQIDYAREMAFVAFRGADSEMLGTARLSADPDYTKAEFAVMVRSDLKGQGVGWALMNHLICYARAEGLETLFGSVLAENKTMIRMCQELGFQVEHDPKDATIYSVALDLRAKPASGASPR